MAAQTAVQNVDSQWESYNLSYDGRNYIVRALELGPTRNVTDMGRAAPSIYCHGREAASPRCTELVQLWRCTCME